MVKVNTVGLVGAVLGGGWHFVWAILVATGLAQVFYDFILWAHMIHLPIIIGPFDATAAVTLIVVTSVIGYVFGYSTAVVWNRVHRA